MKSNILPINDGVLLEWKKESVPTSLMLLNSGFRPKSPIPRNNRKGYAYTGVSTFPEVRGINLNLGRNLSYELLRILDTKSIHPRKFADSIYHMAVSRSCKVKQNNLNQEVKSEKNEKTCIFQTALIIKRTWLFRG